MSITKVKEFFRQFGIEDKIIEFDVSSATVELASKALNCEEGKIAKSLAFSINNRPVIIVMSGNMKTSNQKFKLQFGCKATMLSLEETENLIGHKVGGVCPFAINEGVDVYLDISLKKYTTVFPACGSSNSAIVLSIEELEKYSNYLDWIDVSQERA